MAIYYKTILMYIRTFLISKRGLFPEEGSEVSILDVYTIIVLGGSAR